MAALPLILTNAGLEKVVDAQGGGLAAIIIAEVGLTATPFEAGAETTEIPDEIKRLDALSGAAVDATTVHLTARDHTSDDYEFNGFGVYLADGTLFGVYSQEEAIAGKATVSLLFLAFDFKLSAPVAELFEFGDANFLNPPATTETKGVVERATLAEVQAGVDDERYVTPELLAAVYVALTMLGVADGVATLGPDGKLQIDQRPNVDVIDVWPVESEAEMLLVDGSPGDIAVRTDTGSDPVTDPQLVFMLQQEPASVLGNWITLGSAAPVTSVNSKTGAVVLTPADIGAVPTTRIISGLGLATGGGSLADDRAINVPKASAEETIDGVIDNKAVTPASLAAVLAAIGAGVPSSRTITGSGLVTGGGNLAANRVLDVAIASEAEVLAAVINNKAVTPAGLAAILELFDGLVGEGRKINTGGLVTGGGTLAADRTVTVTAASAAEALGGAITTKALTPASLASLLARTITGSGLATGGGSIGGGNRVIDVPAASGAEALAMAIGNKALTPASLASVIRVSGSGTTRIYKIGPIIIQAFQITSPAESTQSFSFPETFPTACAAALVEGGGGSSDADDNNPVVVGRSTSSVTVFNARDSGTYTCQILAIGH